MLNITALLTAGALAAGLTMGGWLGYRVAAGSYETRIADAATAAIEAQNVAVVAANRAAAAERKRAVLAIEARAAQAALAQGVIHEAHADPGPADCEWRPAQRVRVERVYTAYGAGGEAPAAGVSDAVRGTTTDEPAARGLGIGDPPLGLRLPGAAQGLRGGADQ